MLNVSVLCMCVFVKGGDKLTLALSGIEEKKEEVEEVDATSGRSPTPVTVTHFSWGEAGKLEQRVVSPSHPRSPTSFLSLSLSQSQEPSSLSYNNPFNPFVSTENKTGTNPFLTSSSSNPFVEVNNHDGSDLMAKENKATDENHVNVGKEKEVENLLSNGDVKIPTTPVQKEHAMSPILTSPNTARLNTSDKVNGILEPQRKISRVSKKFLCFRCFEVIILLLCLRTQILCAEELVVVCCVVVGFVN